MPTCRAMVVGTDGAATTPADVHRPAEHRGAGHATADRATKDRAAGVAAGVVADSAAEPLVEVARRPGADVLIVPTT